MRLRNYGVLSAAALALALVGASSVFAQAAVEAPAPAEIVNDEGGPVVVVGDMIYTNPELTATIAQPLIILEDQAGFVDRNKGFLMSPQSQVMGQFTSDFFTSPASFTIPLPIEPQGEYRDVNFDDVEDQGVQIFAAAFWSNIFGPPVLEERDLFGGGWSSAYVSTLVDQNPGGDAEILGGKYLVYAPDDQQGFPSDFGPDGLLFTGDETIVTLPQGYTVVDLDTEPFTFDRSRTATMDLIEGEAAALKDFSELSYTEAFDAMIDLYRTEYSFTELKGLDWDAISAEFRPRFEEAEANNDRNAYLFALRDFTWAIPDGHVFMASGDPVLDEDFFTQTQGGLGLAIRDVDDGRTIVNFILPSGPADAAGIQLGAEIVSINGVAISEAVDNTQAFSAPFSTPWNERLQNLRYVIRFPLGTDVELEYINPGETDATSVTLTTVEERDSFRFSSFAAGLTGVELPLDFQILDSGFMYVRVYSFFDNEVLTVQLWERMINALNANGIPGVIIDMRQNGGGSGFLATQMAAYFFQEPLVVSFDESFSRTQGMFVREEDRPDRFYLPPENLRYDGLVSVLVGPSCASACESFSFAMTQQDRATIVGQYPTAGLGGARQVFAMPEGQFVTITVTRTVTPDGDIAVEGKGVAPTLQVPVTEETLFYDGDVILDTAVNFFNEQLGVTEAPAELTRTEGGEIALDTPVTGQIAVGERVSYTFTSEADLTVTVDLSGGDGQFDTYLRVFDTDGNLLAENDDREPGANFNSLVEGIDVTAGVPIVIEVGTYADGAEGEYTLLVTAAE